MLIKQFKHNDQTIKIYCSVDHEIEDDPRTFDSNLTKMVLFKTHLGDSHSYNFYEYDSWDDIEEAIVQKENPKIIRSVYLLDHSGLKLSMSAFSCSWDSGQVGFIYSTETDDIKLLEAEIEIYDHYINGRMYGYVLEDKDGEEIDSTWGFYGDDFNNNGMSDCLGFEIPND